MRSQELPYSSPARVVGITARTAHILVASVYLGGRLWDVPVGKLRVWRHLTATTGVVLLASEVMHSRNWAHQGRGLTTMAHIGALVPGALVPRLAKAAPVAAALIGSVGSHLPRAIRKWSILTGTVLP